MAYLSLQQHIQDSENSKLIEVLKERDIQERIQGSSIVTINEGFSLWEELIIEILSRLPVKTLLQFKSVSKSWHTIITSSHFVSKHLENYYNNNHAMDCFLTLHSIEYGDPEVELYGRFFNETLGIYINSKLAIAAPPNCTIDGPCNGIYYLAGSYDGEKRLWNPTINDLKVLPPMIMRPDLPAAGLTRYSYVTQGFGYDPLTKDYKVVSINKFHFKCRPISLFVYSLMADSWKYWGDLPPCYDIVQNNSSHIFVNGCLYWKGLRWIGLSTELAAIISFNIITNVLQEIESPVQYDKDSETSLGIYKDSLAFYTIPIFGSKSNFDIWTFNKGGWTKKFTIPVEGAKGVVHLIGHLKNDMAILGYDYNLVLCDPNTAHIFPIAKSFDSYLCESIVVYMESLVSVNGSSMHARSIDMR